MGQKKRILLYGNSVILGCVGASLERSGRFEVSQLAAPLPSPSQLEALDPEVILFDPESGRPDPAFVLLEDRPELLLLSISPDGNVVRMWSGREYQELSTMDLAALIEAGSPADLASSLNHPPGWR